MPSFVACCPLGESRGPTLGAAKNATTLHADRLAGNAKDSAWPFQVYALTRSSCVLKHWRSGYLTLLIDEI